MLASGRWAETGSWGAARAGDTHLSLFSFQGCRRAGGRRGLREGESSWAGSMGGLGARSRKGETIF